VYLQYFYSPKRIPLCNAGRIDWPASAGAFIIGPERVISYKGKHG
jgi:hypothetical protein